LYSFCSFMKAPYCVLLHSESIEASAALYFHLVKGRVVGLFFVTFFRLLEKGSSHNNPLLLLFMFFVLEAITPTTNRTTPPLSSGFPAEPPLELFCSKFLCAGFAFFAPGIWRKPKTSEESYVVRPGSSSPFYPRRLSSLGFLQRLTRLSLV